MKRRIGRAHRRLLVAAAIVIGATIFATRAGTSLIRVRDISEPEAILVLASREWERLPEAAARARQTTTARVLLTVPRAVSELNCHRCSERRVLLAELGVDADRVAILPAGVENTLDEARAALEFCRHEGVRRLLVVTSPYHSRRALATFDHVFARSGITVGVQPSSGHSQAVPERWWAAPYDRWYVRYEWSAVVFYFVRYGIAPWG